jgi:Lipid A 3-O-deacylase (PagL)
LRLGSADVYVNYSLAGPALISKVVIDGEDTGKHFTFQDFFGIGAYVGKARRLNVEIKIMHFSNGNLAPQNAGVAIPLTFNLGYTFD